MTLLGKELFDGLLETMKEKGVSPDKIALLSLHARKIEIERELNQLSQMVAAMLLDRFDGEVVMSLDDVRNVADGGLALLIDHDAGTVTLKHLAEDELKDAKDGADAVNNGSAH